MLKRFRRKSSTVKIFCSDTHLNFFDILQVCYNKIVDIYIMMNNDANDDNRTDENITERIHKYSAMIRNNRVYRIPLRYFCDIVKVNFSVKFNMNLSCVLETNMA